MSDDFFPFNPRAARLGFLLGALGCVGLVLWAVLGTLHHTERMGEARAAVSLGLMLAFLYARFRLRPRPGWGVTLGPQGLTVARPLSPGALEVPWERVQRIVRTGRRRDALLVLLEDEQRILIARHLFARKSTFEALLEALQKRVPEPVLDA